MRYFRTTDPVQQRLRRSFIQCRSQAKHRGQAWNIDFDDYVFMWRANNNYLRKGRRKNDLHFCRIDDTGDWNPNNVQIVTRGEHLSKRMLKHYAR